MQDHKKISPWFRIPSGDYAGAIGRVEYGFSCMGGNPGPYFSLTGEVWDSKKNKLEPKGRDCLCCGQCHFLVPMAGVSGLESIEPFHMCDPDRGPMHYEANALYWLDEANKWDNGLACSMEAARGAVHFRSIICWGSLPTDVDDPVPNLLLVGIEGRKLWLSNRLPALLARFRELVADVGLAEQMEAALAEYRA